MYPQHDDQQHLTILSICHYVYGGFVMLFACFPLIYVLVGVGLVAGAPSMEVDDPQEQLAVQFMGGMFAVIGTIAAGIGLVFGLLTLVAAYCLGQRRGYIYCLIVAGIECLNMPLGTILGVFTIVVLVRPSVRQLFGAGPPVKQVF